MNESPSPEMPSGEVERAEELVDAMSERVSTYASRLRRAVVKTVALAREEADDIWAEAQDMNRNP